MHRKHLTTVLLSAVVALLTHTWANAANPCPSYQRHTGTRDCLYKREVDDAATRIVWGNQATPERNGEVLSIDPPLLRLGPSEPRVEVLEFFRFHTFRRKEGRGPQNRWKRNADALRAKWRASVPDTVNVIQIPVAYHRGVGEHPFWAPLGRIQLRMVLVGRALQIEDALGQSIGAALDRMSPDEPSFTTQTLAREHFKTAHRIDPAVFDTLWTSDEIEEQMSRSMNAYSVVWSSSVTRSRGRGMVNPRTLPPVFLVNGKHIVASFNVKHQQHTFRLANEFIARELAPGAERSHGAEDGRWQALYEELRRVQISDIAYEKVLTPETGSIIEIDPPLSTATGADAVEIEWFFTYLHRGHNADNTRAWLTGRLENLLLKWIDTVPEANFAQLRGRFTPVTAIPGHPGTSLKQARMLQELVLGHGYTTSAEPGERRPTHISFPIHQAVRWATSFQAPPEFLDESKEVKRMLQKAELDTADYRKAARSGVQAQRADTANARLAKLVERAKKVAPGAFRAPAYPIILIDGRYLITGANAGGYTNAARLANHVIGQRLAERNR